MVNVVEFPTHACVLPELKTKPIPYGDAACQNVTPRVGHFDDFVTVGNQGKGWVDVHGLLLRC